MGFGAEVCLLAHWRASQGLLCGLRLCLSANRRRVWAGGFGGSFEFRRRRAFGCVPAAELGLRSAVVVFLRGYVSGRRQAAGVGADCPVRGDDERIDVPARRLVFVLTEDVHVRLVVAVPHILVPGRPVEPYGAGYCGAVDVGRRRFPKSGRTVSFRFAAAFWAAMALLYWAVSTSEWVGGRGCARPGLGPGCPQV